MRLLLAARRQGSKAERDFPLHCTPIQNRPMNVGRTTAKSLIQSPIAATQPPYPALPQTSLADWKKLSSPILIAIS